MRRSKPHAPSAESVKLVLDSNVLVSALLWSGSPARLLFALTHGKATLVLSPALEAELTDVLGREKFASRLSSAGLTKEEVVAGLRSFVEMTLPPVIPAPAKLRDPKDALVLACAIAANATAIVSGDKDLLVLGSFHGIPIIPVAEALRRFSLAT